MNLCFWQYKCNFIVIFICSLMPQSLWFHNYNQQNGWILFLQSVNIFGGNKSKIFYHEKLVLLSDVGFLIRYMLNCAQHHPVDFWKKKPANFNFIWLEWNSYNSSIQFHIVWSRPSIFKLKCSLDRGWPKSRICMNLL